MTTNQPITFGVHTSYITIILIINSLIFSKMYYCSAVWSNTSQRNIEKLQAVQNFAARIVTGTRKYDHVTPVLQQLGWLPVKYMLKLREAIFAFKCLKGLAPSYLCEKFHVRLDVHDANTRQKNILDIPLFGYSIIFEHFIIGLCPCGILCLSLLKTLIV